MCLKVMHTYINRDLVGEAIKVDPKVWYYLHDRPTDTDRPTDRPSIITHGLMSTENGLIFTSYHQSLFYGQLAHLLSKPHMLRTCSHTHVGQSYRSHRTHRHDACASYPLRILYYWLCVFWGLILDGVFLQRSTNSVRFTMIDDGVSYVQLKSHFKSETSGQRVIL